MKRILFFIFCVVAILLFSCTIRRERNLCVKLLDVGKLEKMRSKWKQLGIRNYSFNYRIWRGMPFVCAKVKVTDGVGKVQFTKGDEYRQTERIASIDDAFDYILKRYIIHKKHFDKGEIFNLYYSSNDFSKSEKYNDEYFFPEYFVVSYEYEDYDPKMIGSGAGYSVVISDFKVLE